MARGRHAMHARPYGAILGLLLAVAAVALILAAMVHPAMVRAVIFGPPQPPPAEVVPAPPAVPMMVAPPAVEGDAAAPVETRSRSRHTPTTTRATTPACVSPNSDSP